MANRRGLVPGKGSLPHHFDERSEGPTRSRSPPREVNTVTTGPSVTVTETPSPDGIIRTTTTANDDMTRVHTIANLFGGSPETSTTPRGTTPTYALGKSAQHDNGPKKK